MLVLLPPRGALHAAHEVLLRKEGMVSAFFGPDLSHGEVTEILAAGAVCYLRDTEDPTEAAARLLATLRRGISGEYPRIVASFVRVGVLELDPDGLTLMGPSGSTRVTETESKIFSFLASASSVPMARWNT